MARARRSTSRKPPAKKAAKARGASDRCWPGYEPVPGEAANAQGSCRPKPKSRLTSAEKRVRTRRKKQVDRFQAKHPGARRSAAQGHGEPKGA